jgi:hypothetical protein
MRTFDLTRNQGNNAILFTRFPLVAQALKLVAVPCGPQRRPVPQNKTNSNTSVSQHFLPIDYEPKIKSRKTHFVRRPPLRRLRRRFAPLRGTQRRCVALRAAPPGRYAPRALRAQPFWDHEKIFFFPLERPPLRFLLAVAARRGPRARSHE